MNLPEDLKDYRAPDAFQIIPPDLALLLLAGLGIFCLLFWPEVMP